MSEQNREELNTAPEASAETYSLASILAEYKSEAFIRNERRLSKAELEKQADAIIAEMKRSVEAQLADTPAPAEPAEEAPAPNAEKPRKSGKQAKILQLPVQPAESDGASAEPPPEPEAPAKEPEPEAPPDEAPEIRRPAEKRRKRAKKEAPPPAEQKAQPEEKGEETPSPKEDAAQPTVPEAEPVKAAGKAEPEAPAEAVKKPIVGKQAMESAREAAARSAKAVEAEATPGPEGEPKAESILRRRRKASAAAVPAAGSETDAEITDAPETDESETAAERAAEIAAERERERAEKAARAERKAAEAEQRAALAEERRIQRMEARARREAEKQARLEKEAEEKRNRPELTFEEVQKDHASGISFLSRRLLPTFVIVGLMAVLTVLAGAELLPGFLKDRDLTVILLIAMQVAVMVLGMDMLTRGILELIDLKPGMKTLVLAANLSALVDAAMMLAGKNRSGELPYCAAAALIMAFDMWGTLCRRCGFRDTLHAMRLASVPTVVTAEESLVEDEIVLTKKPGSARGFLGKCVQEDASERLYKAVTLWYLVLVVILAVAAAYLSGTNAVAHCIACLCCAAATLTGALTFGRPFSKIAKKLNNNGAALAGWSGAQDMLRADGMVVRDLDVFPENTIIMNGMKVLSGALVEKVIAYTGSVILATGSGLKRIFGEMMRQYAAPLYHVEDFNCGTEGGVSAFIHSEQVLVGSSAYMNLMGIRVPSSVDVSSAVYTAINHELCGIFIVNYTPVETVQNALYRLETGKLQPIFAVRDFNIHPAMLIQKFRLTEGSVPFLPVETRYELSIERESENQPAALLSREGLWHYSEAARCGRRLVRTVRRALAMTAAGSVLGVLVAFLSCARGSFGAVSPAKLMAAMLLWAFAVLMIADSAEGD